VYRPPSDAAADARAIAHIYAVMEKGYCKVIAVRIACNSLDVWCFANSCPTAGNRGRRLVVGSGLNGRGLPYIATLV